jgi:hypothetical protein
LQNFNSTSMFPSHFHLSTEKSETFCSTSIPTFFDNQYHIYS